MADRKFTGFILLIAGMAAALSGGTVIGPLDEQVQHGLVTLFLCGTLTCMVGIIILLSKPAGGGGNDDDGGGRRHRPTPKVSGGRS